MSEEREDAIIYFVSGYIARVILKTTKCQLCSQLICESRDMPPVLFCDDANSEPDRKTAFLDQINRGGLVKPSDLVCSVVVYVPLDELLPPHVPLASLVPGWWPSRRWCHSGYCFSGLPSREPCPC
jgi:hypothetical protein